MTYPSLPQFKAAQLQANGAALVHALCGAQYGDLELDVGKSIRWTQWFVDDVHITDVNLGSPRYWIVNWTVTFPQAFHTVTGINFFAAPVKFRKEQWRLAKMEQGLQFDADDWVLFLDAHEGLAVDTRDPQPPNFDVEPFKSYLYREIQRAEAAAKDRVVLPFYAFVKHANITTVYFNSPAYASGNLGYTTAASAMGTPYYVPYQGMTRLIKVRVLDDPAFDWSTIDTPSTPATGLNMAVVSYGYAHWNLQDIVPPATTTEPLTAVNDDGWRMRQLISMVRPVAGLPSADPWKDPSQDTNGIPGPWAAADQFTPDPIVDSGPYLNPVTGTVSTPDAADLRIIGDVRITAKVRDDSAEASVSRYVVYKVDTPTRAYAFLATFGNSTQAVYAMQGYPTGVPGSPTISVTMGSRAAWELTPPGVDRYIGATFVGVNPTSQAIALQARGIASVDGVTWTPRGTVPSLVRADALSAVATARLMLGQAWQGRIYWAQMEAINQARLMFPGIVGNFLEVPDAASLRVTTSFEVVVRAQVDWQSVTLINTFASRYATTGTGGRCWYFYMDPTLPGRPRLAVSVDGVVGTTATSTVAVPFTTEMGWLKATYDSSIGVVQFFTAPDAGTALEPTTWTKLGGDRTGLPTSIFAGTPRMLIGRHDVSDNGPLTGRLARFIYRNGIGVTTPQLVFPGAAGNWLTIPTAASHIPTGDAEFVARVSMPDWSAPLGIVLAKNGSYYFLVGNNTVSLWSPATFPASSALGLANGATVWVKATRVAATGLTSFYSAPDSPTEPTSWTARGTSTGPTGAYPNPSTVLSLGAYNTNGSPLRGRILRAILRDGIGGPVVVDVNESNVPQSAIGVAGATFPATAGGTATVNQRQQPIFTFPGVVGNNLSVPDAAALRVTGDITVIGRVALTDWTAGSGTILARFTSAQQSYLFQMNTAGRPLFQWSPDGTAGSAINHTAPSGIPGLVNGQPIWVAATLDVDNGAGGRSLRFFYGTNGVTWTQLGTTITVAGTTSIFAGINALMIGQRTDAASPWTGTISRAIVRNGIAVSGDPTGGTAVLDVSQDNATVGATSFPATTGGTVTINQTAGVTISQPDPSFQFPLVQGTLFELKENNAGVLTDATHFAASTGQSVGINQTAGQTVVQPQPDTLVWRFDAKDYPGTGTVFTDPRGRQWTLTAAGALVANTIDNMPQPVTPDPSLAGLLVPLYDNVLRLNLRDGVWYEGGELGNIPLAWDDATQTWYPRNMSPQEWHNTEEWVAPLV